MRIDGRAKRQAKRLFRLCLVNGGLDANRARHVVQRVLLAGHPAGPAILARLSRLVRLDLARRTATIESAAPLPADLQASIEADLTLRYGRGLTIAFAHRPALIGGMRIKVGSDVYDGSVRAWLTALENGF